MKTWLFKILAAVWLCSAISGLAYHHQIADSKKTHIDTFKQRCQAAIAANERYTTVTAACHRQDPVLDHYEEVDFWLFCAVLITGMLTIMAGMLTPSGEVPR